MNSSITSSLNEDQKKYRKYMKILRQIEHLELLTRDLNNDEKLKVKRFLIFLLLTVLNMS